MNDLRGSSLSFQCSAAEREFRSYRYPRDFNYPTFKNRYAWSVLGAGPRAVTGTERAYAYAMISGLAGAY
jgi:hypothetical protein